MSVAQCMRSGISGPVSVIKVLWSSVSGQGAVVQRPHPEALFLKGNLPRHASDQFVWQRRSLHDVVLCVVLPVN